MKALGLGASDDLAAITWTSVTLPELSCMQEHTHFWLYHTHYRVRHVEFSTLTTLSRDITYPAYLRPTGCPGAKQRYPDSNYCIQVLRNERQDC